MKFHVPTASLIFTLLLTACGGGGGGSSRGNPAPPAPEPEPLPPPIETPAAFSISGSITVAGNLTADSDTNNPQADLISNNALALAQPIFNPSTLGGYVAQPGAGDDGPAKTAGDIDDFFQIELLAGQRVTLLVADFEQADADLYLYDENNQIVDFSIETGEIESIEAPADGTYIVNVFAFSGATNYALATGTSTINNATSVKANRQAQIIPWQAVVLHEDPAKAPETLQTSFELNQRMGLQRKAGGSRHDNGRYFGSRSRPQLMSIKPVGASSMHDNRLRGASNKRGSIADAAAKARWETLMTIKSLNKEAGIDYAEPNYRVHASAVPDDEAYPTQWHYPLINLPAAWDLSTGDPSVIVAVVDTGILSGHPDLAGKLVPGYDFIADADAARDGNGIDPDPTDEGDGSEVGNSSFHGTHVSGTIAAASNNQIGVAGVAWDARIMPLRVLGVDGGSTYDVGQAVRFAAGLPNDSETLPSQRADIINLSLGGASFSQSTQALYDQVRAAGVMVVAAAGNEASGSPSYPASFDGVISVSAVDSQRRAAAYSNFGNFIDIAAPGGDNGEDLNGDGYPDGVLSTGGSAGSSGATNFVYSFLNGTSMAAPHVAGVLALMKSANPDLTPEDVDALLIQGELSDDLGATGRDDRFGHGLINAQRAVVAALNAAGNPPADNPFLGASSSTLNFGSAANNLGLLLQNSGRGTLELLELSTSEDWLQLSADNVDENGLGTYTVTVDRQGLAAGIYSATITAISDVNSLTVDVLASVVDVATGGNVGLIYLLLIDPAKQEVVAQFNAAPAPGGAPASEGYRYQFNDIPTGSYEFFAGTDADNDTFICDSGEACGAYLTTDQPILIELSENLENVEFPIEYRVALPNISAAENKTIVGTEQQKSEGIPRLK